MKRSVFGIIVILCCVLVALLFNSCQSCSPSGRRALARESVVMVADSSKMLTWDDDISNPANWEYVNDVRFAHPEVEDDYQLQLLFCDRYYETLDTETLEWNFVQLSNIKSTFHVWIK